MKEPLLHFLLIGAAMFFLYGWRGGGASGPAGQGGSPGAQIVVTREARDQMEKQFAKTWQRPPTEEEQRGLIEDYVRNEIFYREAIAIGLDRDDEVFKRRLRQRMEFVYEDISSLADPSDADLAAFMEKHREKYLADPRVSFRQVFINTSRRGKNAETDARQALARLPQGAEPATVGDSTLLEPELTLATLRDISNQFGDAFGKSIVGLKPGTWSGPIRSTFGLHLVIVDERVDGRLPAVEEIREILKRDWTDEKQKELKDAAYARIRERYSVTVEKPIAAPASTAAATSTGGTTR